MDDKMFRIHADIHIDNFETCMTKKGIDVNFDADIRFNLVEDDDFNTSALHGVINDIPEELLPSGTLDNFMKQTGFVNVCQDPNHFDKYGHRISFFRALNNSAMNLKKKMRLEVLEVLNQRIYFSEGDIRDVRLNHVMNQNEMRMIKLKSNFEFSEDKDG